VSVIEEVQAGYDTSDGPGVLLGCEPDALPVREDTEALVAAALAWLASP
jgi:hypothetical protein